MPSFRNYILDKGYDAESAIDAFTAVKGGSTDEGVVQCDSQGEDGRGIAQFGVTADEIDLGKGASVALAGISEWTVGTQVDKDQLVTVASDGTCEPAANGDYVWGRALQAGEAADRISVELFQSKYVHA